MQLGYIMLFQAILQTGSVTAAAALLHISQPAASKRLQQAERVLGFALFHRERGKLVPTRQALILQAPAERLVADVRQFTRLAHSLRPEQQSELRLTCTPTLAQHLLPLSLVAWRAEYPILNCHLATEHTPALVAALLAEQTDLGLTLQSVSHPQLSCEELAFGQMQVLAPAGFWSTEQVGMPLALDCLAGLKMIGLDDKDGLGALLDSHMQGLAPPLSINTRVQTYQLARHMVLAGQGLAVVDPFTGIAAAADGTQMRPLSPPLWVTLYGVSRVGQALTRPQQALWQELRRTAQALLA